MSIYQNESSAALKRQLDQAVQEGVEKTDRLARDLEQARERKMSPAYVKELEARLEKLIAFNAKVIGDLKIALGQAQERERQQEEAEKQHASDRAAAVKETIRAELLAAYLQAGGDHAGFEQEWPELYREELKRRTQAERRNADKQVVDLIRSV
jgi:hypothetical protein